MARFFEVIATVRVPDDALKEAEIVTSIERDMRVLSERVNARGTECTISHRKFTTRNRRSKAASEEVEASEPY